MDNFEKHIIENKQLFDDQKADRAKLWANIESKLDNPEPKVVPLWKSPLLRIAASVVFVLGMSAFIWTTMFTASNNTIQNGFVSQELQDIDVHYKSLVSNQVQLVKDHPKLSDKDKEEFLQFMVELDEEYALLKLEMQKNLDNEIILEAIVGNYKKRIELIENLLRQINDAKKTNDDYEYIL